MNTHSPTQAGDAAKPRTDEKTLEERIADRPYDKVTAAGISGRIRSVSYANLAASPTVTICSIVLDNGYSVRGEAACVDPRNFEHKIGQELAYKDAFGKLWPLFGFLLAEQMFRNPLATVEPEALHTTEARDTSLGASSENVTNIGAAKQQRPGRDKATVLLSGNFGDAIMQLRAGNRVARNGWNGKRMWLQLRDKEKQSVQEAPRLPYIEMFTAQGSLIPWLASQTDMLADDWYTVA